jgi:hypothetical protein
MSAAWWARWAVLHPLEYVAMNALAGGTHGAYGNFELDYWSAAATEALRRLERRLDYDPAVRAADSPPSIVICIPWREHLVDPMLKRPWALALRRQQARGPDRRGQTLRPHLRLGVRAAASESVRPPMRLLHARPRFPISRCTVVTMRPGLPIAILPGIVTELGASLSCPSVMLVRKSPSDLSYERATPRDGIVAVTQP